MRTAAPARRPRDIASSSEDPPPLVRYVNSRCALESRRDHDGQERGCVSLDCDLAGGLLHLSPGNPLSNAGPAQRSIMFLCGRDIHREIEPAAELIPPDRVMLGDAAPDHQRVRALGGEYDVREISLVTELLDAEILVFLPDRPQLI